MVKSPVTKPVVEILTFPTSEAFQKDPVSTGALGLALLTKADGCLCAYYGIQVEDANVGYLFVVWETYEHHQKWTAHPEYIPAMKGLRKCLAGKYNFQHIDFIVDPNNALGAPVTEILSLKLKSNASKRKLILALDGLSSQVNTLRETYSPCTWGESREYPGRYTFIAGWRSKEAHTLVQTASKGSSFLKNLLEEADIAMAHARLHRRSMRVLAVL
ncbi:hypothetical protein BDQ17DRAFT_1536908 [Cyathus striatus]|nr:hypothetical protein BDQ17DRAFT_1536908 [Cyathus striatus]